MDSPAPIRNMGTLGTLFLVGRKSQQDIQSFPIDCERITIGRDYDCNIRLYFSDVSKFHCEIIFDLLTGRASLHVHGSNGLKYIPSGSTETIEKIPPAAITLSDGDVFVVRKKYFRFEYGPEETLEVATPSRQTPAKSRAGRRSSHRLSLVPTGKTFMASPAKRRQSIAPPAPSKLSTMQVGAPKVDAEPALQAEDVTEEDLELSKDGELDLVDVVEGEDGDRIYLEVEESFTPADTEAAVLPHRFMTPQAKAKAPLRNTSAVPRTRMANFAAASTPRAPAPSTPTHIPAQIAMTTPKGPSTLRKALLLKSARKTWHETRSPQSPVENAIEDGNVQVRRKSRGSIGLANALSPSKSPVPLATDEGSSSEEDSDEMKDGVNLEDPQLSAVQSDHHDMTTAPKIRIAHESMEQGPETYEPESLEDREKSVEEGFSGDSLSEEDDLEDEMLLDQEEEIEDDEEDDDDTPDARITLTPTTMRGQFYDRFYTPQIQRTSGPTRTPLSAFGGPPRPLGHMINPPRSLGRPERIVQTMRMRVPPSPITEGAAREKPQAKAERQDDIVTRPPPSDRPTTPMRNAMRAEANRIRRSVATTPRRLPAPPTSGFRKMPVDVSPFRLSATPQRHRALELTSPPPQQAEVPATPLDNIKNRLANLKRKSATVGQDRRGTSNSTETPARRAPHAISATGLPDSKLRGNFLPVDSLSSPTPGILNPVNEEVCESPLAYRDLPATAALQDILPKRLSDASSLESIGNSTQSTASLSPPRALSPTTFTAKQAPQTPNLRGLKHLYPTRPAAATPSFVGIKQMYQYQKALPVAQLDGVAEMYEVEEFQDVADMIQVAAPSPVKKVFSMREIRTEEVTADDEVQEQVEDPAEEEKEEVEDKGEATVPAKRGRSASQLAAVPASPPKMTRTRRNAVPELRNETAEAKAAPARTRRAVQPVVKEDAVEPKSTSTRSRRAPTVETGGAEAKSAPSRTRRVAANKAEDDAPSKPSTSRRRVKKAESSEPPSVPAEPASKSSRSRTTKTAEPLFEAIEAVQDKIDPPSPPSKRSATTTIKKTRTTSSSASKVAKVMEDKENVPESEKLAPKARTKKATTQKTSEGLVEETSAPSRRTRSRA